MHTAVDISLLSTFVFCVVGFETLISGVKMECVKMPSESQVEKHLLIHGAMNFCRAGVLPAPELVLHILAQLMNCLSTSLHQQPLMVLLAAETSQDGELAPAEMLFKPCGCKRSFLMPRFKYSLANRCHFKVSLKPQFWRSLRGSFHLTIMFS